MRQLVLEKEKSEFKPVTLRLKSDFVSYPARAEGLVNMVEEFHVLLFNINNFIHQGLVS